MSTCAIDFENGISEINETYFNNFSVILKHSSIAETTIAISTNCLRHTLVWNENVAFPENFTAINRSKKVMLHWFKTEGKEAELTEMGNKMTSLIPQYHL
uniref:Uncharacterized protein n=1 Tax=Onchocerca volvulus TaxID=6282 RepID=A0A8R1TTV2_ONCVO